MSNLDQKCRYCGGTGEQHDAICPKADESAFANFDAGYNDARAGKRSESENASYLLGYRWGEGALETAQNTRREDY